MPLHFENKMGKHDESLKRFIDRFNKVEPLDIYAKENEELYICDAFFIVQGYKVFFDWEKRWDFWKDGVKFPFPSLYQFNRKFKFRVDLCVQCNTTESAIAVAWHKDFGHPFTKTTTTQNGKIEDRLRETRTFMTFSMHDLRSLKAYIKLHHNQKTYKGRYEYRG